MKNIRKYLYIVVCTAVLLCIVAAVSPEPEMPLPHFLVQSPEAAEKQEISMYSPGDGNYYVFLPSYTSMDLVTISLPSNHFFSLGDSALTDGMTCGDFVLETPYLFTVDDQQTAVLWFYQSANVPAMYIDTVSGNMKYLHQNKDHEENASIMLYTEVGKADYFSEVGVLSGRGNVTWEYDKRPYTLTLSADDSLLDMAPAKKWVLLANAADETNLNNKLILDLAARVGRQWTPDSRWVDLYLNGEYSGLYLLIEKVEVQPERLNLDSSSGDFLCRIDLDSRWSTLRNPLLTEAGRTVEISYPQILSEGMPDEIKARVSQLEQAIFSGENLRESPILDLDSWVRRYLIDEISANIDADLASSYFYYSGGTIYAGPVWDYDMTLGNAPRNQDPCAFIAKNAWKSNTFHSPYYDALYKNESFYNRMLEIYRMEFVPELQKLLSSDLDAYISHLQQASQCNSLRWRSMYDNLPANVVHTPAALKDYFSRRIRFLDSVWLENTEYCTVQFESSPGSSYLNFSVRHGHVLETPYVNAEIIWVDSVTGDVFDFHQPIVRDRILTRQRANASGSDAVTSDGASRQAALSTMDYFLFLLMATPVTLVMIFLGIDRIRRKQEQKTVSHSGTSS